MDKLDKSWVYFWLGIALIVFSTITAGWWFESWKTVQMAKQGYVQRIVPGKQSFAWQKVK